jgi:hypothetical protein
MTREEAMAKARQLSRTGVCSVGVSESDYLNDDGTIGHYAFFNVTVDRFGLHSEPSYESCFKKIEKQIETERVKVVERLRRELAVAEAAITPEGDES